jgi:hypothetical protein
MTRVQNIAPIIDQLNRTRASLLALIAKFQDERWSEPPPGGAWSPGEIIAHLIMVETRVSSHAARIVQAPAIRVPAWKRIHVPVAFVQWRLIRVKTPIPLDTKLIGEKDSMLGRFAEIRRQTVALLLENHQRELGDYRFPHPFFGSLNIYDCFRFLALHEVRHTKQMQENVDSRLK